MRNTGKRRPRKTAASAEAVHDPALDLPLDAALRLFHAQPALTLPQIAAAARLDSRAEAAFSAAYRTPGEWLTALLNRHDLSGAFEAAIAAVAGEEADELLRDAMRRMVALADKHSAYFELALIEAEAYQGATLNNMSGRLLPAANGLLQKIKQTGQLRPLPDWLIARAMVALLIGFIASERVMPTTAQFAARLLPQRLWVDSLTDILLYGLIEDTAR